MKTALFLVICCAALGNAANILGLFSVASKSHYMSALKLFKELAARGHKITVASPYASHEAGENYSEIVIFETIADIDERGFFGDIFKHSMSLASLIRLNKMTTRQAELLFLNEDMQTLIGSNQKFDLVVMDWFFNDSHLVFGHIFDCPVIPIATAGSSVFSDYTIGNTAPVAYIPFKYYNFDKNMSFVQRMINSMVHVFVEFYIKFVRYQQNEILRKHVPGAPTCEELLRRVAILFSNSHSSYELSKPSFPNQINVGGMHVEAPKALPNDLKEFLDSAKNGAILFSLGTNMKSKFLSKETIAAIIRVFSKSDLKVVWKFEDSALVNETSNLFVSKWIPQNDVLAHPNLKLFITHGGLLSIIESIYNSVPMIGIPMFGDQNSNVPHIVDLGIARQILPGELTEERLLDNIKAMFADNSYAENVKFRSDLLRNQEMPPMDRAIYWVEYVIKYKGADHLRNGSLDLAWYQNMLLDVLLVVAIISSIILVIFVYLFKLILRKLRQKNELGLKKNL